MHLSSSLALVLNLYLANVCLHAKNFLLLLALLLLFFSRPHERRRERKRNTTAHKLLTHVFNTTFKTELVLLFGLSLFIQTTFHPSFWAGRKNVSQEKPKRLRCTGEEERGKRN